MSHRWFCSDESGPATDAPSAAPDAIAPEQQAELTRVAAEDEMMADVVAMVGGAQGQDALTHLDATLRPVEKYAVSGTSDICAEYLHKSSAYVQRCVMQFSCRRNLYRCLPQLL